MTCSKCRTDFPDDDSGAPVASISGSMIGDEHTDVYYLCPRCDFYTVVQVCEPFLGEEQRSVSGPLSREKGDAEVAVIRECPEPWDKKCRCPSHRAHFGDTLD